MKIILKKDVSGLGKMHDVKNVADGHALNLLFPRGLAIAATPKALAQVETHKAAHEAETKMHENLLLKSLSTLKDSTITLKGKANEKGHLFSGIHTEEISRALQHQLHMAVEPRFIELAKPIKEIGEHEAHVVIGDKKGAFKVMVEGV